MVAPPPPALQLADQAAEMADEMTTRKGGLILALLLAACDSITDIFGRGDDLYPIHIEWVTTNSAGDKVLTDPDPMAAPLIKAAARRWAGAGQADGYSEPKQAAGAPVAVGTPAQTRHLRLEEDGMTLWNEIHRLRKELDDIMDRHRYSEMDLGEAVFACLSDGDWWTVKKVATELRAGGFRDLPRSITVRKYIAELAPEWQYTGAQGGEKEYRLRQAP